MQDNNLSCLSMCTKDSNMSFPNVYTATVTFPVPTATYPCLNMCNLSYLNVACRHQDSIAHA